MGRSCCALPCKLWPDTTKCHRSKWYEALCLPFEIFIKNGQLSFSDIIHNYGYSILWHSDNLGRLATSRWCVKDKLSFRRDDSTFCATYLISRNACLSYKSISQNVKPLLRNKELSFNIVCWHNCKGDEAVSWGTPGGTRKSWEPWTPWGWL